MNCEYIMAPHRCHGAGWGDESAAQAVLCWPQCPLGKWVFGKKTIFRMEIFEESSFQTANQTRLEEACKSSWSVLVSDDTYGKPMMMIVLMIKLLFYQRWMSSILFFLPKIQQFTNCGPFWIRFPLLQVICIKPSQTMLVISRWGGGVSFGEAIN